jgi:hypothetical protein
MQKKLIMNNQQRLRKKLKTLRVPFIRVAASSFVWTMHAHEPDGCIMASILLVQSELVAPMP